VLDLLKRTNLLSYQADYYKNEETLEGSLLDVEIYISAERPE